jgi:uncharacterized SAM-binding protein YcdF (DUF218 family)
MSPLDAIIVLGCRVTGSTRTETALEGAAGRRVTRAAALFRERAPRRVVASGGRTWAGVVEADRMACELERLGVPASSILRERCSMSTAENARFTAALAERHAMRSIIVVTCTWHLPRALLLFQRQGFTSDGVGADAPDPGRLARAYRTIRERVCMHLDGVAS